MHALSLHPRVQYRPDYINDPASGPFQPKAGEHDESDSVVVFRTGGLEVTRHGDAITVR